MPRAVYRVAEFKEKPDEKTARAYMEKGYLWNSGMFLLPAGVFTEEVRRLCPAVAEAFCAADVNEIFEKVPAVSIDYGVMEKSERVAVLPLSTKWSDLGSFDAIYEELILEFKTYWEAFFMSLKPLDDGPGVIQRAGQVNLIHNLI